MSVITYPRITGIIDEDLGENYVRTTRFAIVSSGTSGTVTIPGDAEVIEDDFGGLTDAVVSGVSSGKPSFISALTAGAVVVGTSFDTSGNYVLTGTPASYPVAIIYRVRTKLRDFDSQSSDIIGIPTNIGSGGGSTFPGGSDTQVQFNDSGSFNGDAGFTYNKTTDIATIGGLNLTGLTASQITATDGSKNLQSLSTATYPSLTELSYVKGTTSNIQSQIDSLQDDSMHFLFMGAGS